MVDIHALLNGEGESQTIEFKTSFSEKEEIIDTLVAFANARGGTVLVGIHPDPPHKVIGVSLGKRTLEEFDNRRRDKAGDLSGFTSEIISHNGKTIVVLTVAGHKPGQLFLSAGCALIRASRTNQRMNAAQVRARILEEPALAIGRPRFQIAGGSLRNAQNEPCVEVHRTLQQIDGDFVESIECRFRGSWVPTMDWERIKVEKSPNRLPTATLGKLIDESAMPRTDEEACCADFAVEVRFVWRGDTWHELHRFPMRGWDIGREIMPSLYRRDDGEWLESS